MDVLAFLKEALLSDRTAVRAQYFREAEAGVVARWKQLAKPGPRADYMRLLESELDDRKDLLARLERKTLLFSVLPTLALVAITALARVGGVVTPWMIGLMIAGGTVAIWRAALRWLLPHDVPPYKQESRHDPGLERAIHLKFRELKAREEYLDGAAVLKGYGVLLVLGAVAVVFVNSRLTSSPAWDRMLIVMLVLGGIWGLSRFLRWLGRRYDARPSDR